MLSSKRFRGRQGFFYCLSSGLSWLGHTAVPSSIPCTAALRLWYLGTQRQPHRQHVAATNVVLPCALEGSLNAAKQLIDYGQALPPTQASQTDNCLLDKQQAVLQVLISCASHRFGSKCCRSGRHSGCRLQAQALQIMLLTTAVDTDCTWQVYSGNESAVR